MATIQGVYIALFGRPADPKGLEYFNGVTKNGADLGAIGDLASTKEYTDRFEGQTNVQIINSIYISLFGRSADAAGLEFFAAALTNGTLNIKNIAIAILDGAQGDDALVVANKLTAANAFTAAIDTATETAAYTGTKGADAGRSFLTTVTKEASSIPSADATAKAIADIVTAGTGGVSLTITDGDNVNTTETDAKFKTTDGDDTITVTDAYTAAGKIEASFGNDTLVLKNLAAAVAPAAGQVTGVEKIVVTSTNALASLALTNVTGVTSLVNDSSATALAFTDISAGTTLGLKGTVAATTFTFKAAAVSGSSDAATLSLDAATSGVTTIAGIENLTVANSGTSSVSVTAADAKALVVSGSGSLSLAVTAAGATSFDASASTGSVSVDLSAANALKTVVGAQGGDTISVNYGDNTAALTVDAGKGDDFIVVKAGGAATAFTVSLTGGEGADTFRFENVGNVKTADAADFAKSLITVTDFSAASDIIDFSAVTRDTLTGTELGQVKSAATLFDAVVKAASFTNVGEASVFIYGSDAYIFNNVAGVGFDDNDGLVKIAGVTDVSAFTASNLLFA